LKQLSIIYYRSWLIAKNSKMSSQYVKEKQKIDVKSWKVRLVQAARKPL